MGRGARPRFGSLLGTPSSSPGLLFFFLWGRAGINLVPSTVRNWDSPKTGMTGQGPCVQQHWNYQFSAQPAFHMGAEINVVGTVPSEPSHPVYLLYSSEFLFVRWGLSLSPRLTTHSHPVLGSWLCDCRMAGSLLSGPLLSSPWKARERTAASGSCPALPLPARVTPAAWVGVPCSLFLPSAGPQDASSSFSVQLLENLLI